MGIFLLTFLSVFLPVLDWSYEIVIDSNIQKTLREYTARDLYEIMQKLGSIKNICSSNAKYFLEMLGQKTLPETTVCLNSRGVAIACLHCIGSIFIRHTLSQRSGSIRYPKETSYFLE